MNVVVARRNYVFMPFKYDSSPPTLYSINKESGKKKEKVDKIFQKEDLRIPETRRKPVLRHNIFIVRNEILSREKKR